MRSPAVANEFNFYHLLSVCTLKKDCLRRSTCASFYAAMHSWDLSIFYGGRCLYKSPRLLGMHEKSSKCLPHCKNDAWQRRCLIFFSQSFFFAWISTQVLVLYSAKFDKKGGLWSNFAVPLTSPTTSWSSAISGGAQLKQKIVNCIWQLRPRDSIRATAVQFLSLCLNCSML